MKVMLKTNETENKETLENILSEIKQIKLQQDLLNKNRMPQ